MRRLAFVLFAALAVAVPLTAGAAGPPICPHINTWSSTVQSWAQGAPWMKVLSALDCQRGKEMGSKVFYRPYDIPSHDDGGTGDGTGMAEAVLARLATIPSDKWPDAIGFRNEFGGTDTTTPQQFMLYYDRLRAGGYRGWIVFGSYSTGVPESYRWSQSDVKNAVMKADAIETHEYFDLTEAFCHSWLCCRHVRFINENPYLLGKPWFIGEAGSDRISGGCHEDPCSRRGWRHYDCGAQKLTEQQYISELSKYRGLCASQVVAVFIFQQGDLYNWNDFEVVGTSVGTWMQTTWGISTGTISGTVKSATGQNLAGAAVTTSPGGYSAASDASGVYTIPQVMPGTYNVTASKAGYQNQTRTGISVIAGQTATCNFSMVPNSGTISGYVRDSGGVGIAGAAVSTGTGDYSTTTAANGSYTLSNVTTGTYTVTVVRSGYDSAVRPGVVVNVGQTTTCNVVLTRTPPVITAQPQSLLRSIDQTAVFGLAASGTAPLLYQWRKNGASIPGAVGPAYHVHCVSVADAASYDCVVANDAGSTTSSPAALTVNQLGSLGAWDADKVWSSADSPTVLSQTKWGLEGSGTEIWGTSYGLGTTVFDRNGGLLAMVCDNNGNTSADDKLKYRTDSGEGWVFDNTQTTAVKLGFYAIDSAGAYPALYIRTANKGVQIRYDESLQGWVPGSYAVIGPGSPSILPVALHTWHYIRFQMDPAGNWDAWLNEDRGLHMWGTSTGSGGGYLQMGCLGSTSSNCEFALDFVAWGQGSAIPDFGNGAIEGVVRNSAGQGIAGLL